MSLDDRAGAAINRLSSLNTELAARRELRERGMAESMAASREYMSKVGAVAEKMAEHLAELDRRQRGAGGWATEKVMSDKGHLYGFAPDDEESAKPGPARATAARPDDEPDDDDFSDTSSWLKD
jgi:hypothetical protein